MITTANTNKNKVLSTTSAILLGVASIMGLQGCGGGGGGDDTTAVVPDVTLSSASVSEGNSGTTNLDFTVILSQATTNNVTVSYSTSDGTALAGEDYTETSGTLTVPANATSAIITVTVTGDLVTEDDETFNLKISGAVNGVIANNSVTVVGNIVNDDLAGYYTGSLSVNEGNGTLNLADPEIQVIAANDRLVIINLTNNLVYIAPFTSFSSNSFVTTARIYKDGDFATTTEISGTFITKASMDLTLAGTGEYTTGTVTLAYSATNSATPKIFVAGTSWFIPFDVGILINTPTNIDIATTSDVTSLALDQCDSQSVDLIDVVAEQTGRIRSFIAPTGVSCTDPSTDGTTLDGYLTTFQTTLTDDSMLFVWFNDFGSYAVSLPSP